MNKPIGQAAPVATVSTPAFIGRLTCAIIAPDSERDAEVTGLIAHIDAWQRDVTAKAVADALEGQLAELSQGGALYQPDAWPDAWHALRDDLLSGVDGLDNDQVNTVLGMLDNYEPSRSVQLAAPQQHAQAAHNGGAESSTNRDAQAALSDEQIVELAGEIFNFKHWKQTDECKAEYLAFANAILVTRQPAPVAPVADWASHPRTGAMYKQFMSLENPVFNDSRFGDWLFGENVDVRDVVVEEAAPVAAAVAQGDDLKIVKNALRRARYWVKGDDRQSAIQAAIEAFGRIVARTVEDAASVDGNKLRAQGRAEALAILMGLSAEGGIDAYTGWSKPVGPEDEGDAYWEEPALRELFAVDGTLADMMVKAEAEHYHYLGMQQEAEHAKNFAANMHNSGKVRDVLAKAGEFDLIADLCRATQPSTAQGDAKPDHWIMTTPEAGNKLLIFDQADAKRFAAMDGRKVQPFFAAQRATSQPDSERDTLLGRIVQLWSEAVISRTADWADVAYRQKACAELAMNKQDSMRVAAPTVQQERAWYQTWLAGLDGNITVDQVEFGRRVWAERARRAAEGGA